MQEEIMLKKFITFPFLIALMSFNGLNNTFETKEIKKADALASIETNVSDGKGEVYYNKSIDYVAGDDLEFIVTPEEGYQLEFVKFNDVEIERKSYGTFNVTLEETNTIEVSFYEISYVDVPDDFTYKEDDKGGLTITAYSGLDFDINVPSEHDGKKVVAIGDNAFQNSEIHNISLPSSITTIGTGAFKNSKELNSVKFDGGLETVGGAAFSGCVALANINLPDSTKIIGPQAFADCVSLAEFVFPKDLEIILDQAFMECKFLEEINIPDGVTFIGNEAFSSAENLRSINLPNTIKKLGNEVFSYNYYLEKVNVAPGGRGLWSKDDVLYYGNSLYLYPAQKKGDSFTVEYNPRPNTYILNVAPKAFYTTSYLKNVVLEEGIKRIDNKAFMNSYSIESVSLPESITSYGDSLFYGDRNLKTISLPSAFTTVPSSMFYYCLNLTEAKFKSKITSIGDRAFHKCSSLVSFDIPEGITDIPEYAFAECTSLTDITLPSTLKSIGDSAFYKTTSLKNISIPSSVTSFANEAFRGSGITSISIPAGTKSLEQGLLYGTSISEVDIPEGVTSIEFSALQEMGNLTKVILPKSLKTIGEYFLNDCPNIKEVDYRGTKDEFDKIEVTSDSRVTLDKLISEGKVTFDYKG